MDELPHDDLPDTAERRGRQAGTSARAWARAGWIVVILFALFMATRACGG